MDTLDPNQEEALLSLMSKDTDRLRFLGHVQALSLPDGWIGAGFVRSAVWDHLHGRAPSAPDGDIDVVWFDQRYETPTDQRLEAHLTMLEPFETWSVKNQARMHVHNGDAPYASVADAMRRWPDTATAVALRRVDHQIEILAPYGLDDLFSLTVRPTPAFAGEKRPIFQQRMQDKRWLERWPQLKLA